MHQGKLYIPTDPHILAKQSLCQEFLYDFNHTRPSEGKKRSDLLKKMFAKVGENVYIEPPLHANWGGHFCQIGDQVYANYNLTLVDDTTITIGSNTMIGPNVTIATAGHPILPELREQAYQFNLPVTIGKNCWLGAGVIVLPGVTIGDNSVIGAGSLVTKDIPKNVIALGSPARVLRKISNYDRQFLSKNQEIDWASLQSKK